MKTDTFGASKDALITSVYTEGASTDTLMSYGQADIEDGILRPTLFTCYGRTISEYRLSGCQSIGRPSGDRMPDIPLHARFVSREHGEFITEDTRTYYRAFETTNPIKYRKRVLVPGEKVFLKDGDELIIPWTDEEGRDQSVVLVYTETESRIHMWRDLQKASRDNLTDLIDRDSFAQWWMLNRERKDYNDACLFILDVDDFKKVNDAEGHIAGDAILRLIADELKNAVRYESQVCRWGGDEFVGIIPSSPGEAEARFKMISCRIRERSSEFGIALSVSIGYVNVNEADDPCDITALVELADKALYDVKYGGKNSIAAYNRARS